MSFYDTTIIDKKMRQAPNLPQVYPSLFPESTLKLDFCQDSTLSLMGREKFQFLSIIVDYIIRLSKKD